MDAVERIGGLERKRVCAFTRSAFSHWERLFVKLRQFSFQTSEYSFFILFSLLLYVSVFLIPDVEKLQEVALALDPRCALGT
jgi:hypothetical protein